MIRISTFCLLLSILSGSTVLANPCDDLKSKCYGTVARRMGMKFCNPPSNTRVVVRYQGNVYSQAFRLAKAQARSSVLAAISQKRMSAEERCRSFRLEFPGASEATFELHDPYNEEIVLEGRDLPGRLRQGDRKVYGFHRSSKFTCSFCAPKGAYWSYMLNNTSSAKQASSIDEGAADWGTIDDDFAELLE